MIISTKPELVDKKDTTEIRKALLNLADQINKELKAIEDRLTALEATP